jgi:hypothetical protein
MIGSKLKRRGLVSGRVARTVHIVGSGTCNGGSRGERRSLIVLSALLSGFGSGSSRMFLSRHRRVGTTRRGRCN